MNKDTCVHGVSFADPAQPHSRPEQRFSWDAETDAWKDMGGRAVMPSDFFAGWSVLSLLGVHGCRHIEEAVIAGLALGEPVLLIGDPGSAKTAMCERLASDLGMSFWAYDASKAMFEDIVGFPDPASLSQGKVRYVPTPLSLQGKQFVLVDEVSRAHPALQNKWLEIIRSRRVMGIDLSDLRHVLGAMNPAGLPGTVPLDDALAGRFTFHIAVPDVNRMEDCDRRAVIESSDSLKGWDADGRSYLRWLVRAVRQETCRVTEVFGAEITKYVDALSRFLARKDWKLDGRRQAMMHRGLVAYVATRSMLIGHMPQTQDLHEVLRRGIDFLLPWNALGRDIPRIILDGAHGFARAEIDGRARALPPSDVLEGANAVAGGYGTRDPDQLSMLVTRILQTMDRPAKPEDAVRAGAAMLILVMNPSALRRLPVEARQRIMVGWSDSMCIDPDKVSNFIDESSALPAADLPEGLAEPVARIAYSINSRSFLSRGNAIEFGEAFKMLSEVLTDGGTA